MDQSKDIYLQRNGGATMGFRLRKTEGGKAYRHSRVLDASNPTQTTGLIPGEPPQQKVVFRQDTWHRGAGYEKFADASRFATSEGMDVRSYGKLSIFSSLSTMVSETTQASASQRFFAYYDSVLHMAVGDNLYKLVSGEWDEITSLVGTAQGSISVIKGSLWIGTYDNIEKWNGSSVSTFPAPARGALLRMGDVLWGASGSSGAGEIYSSTTGEVDAWSTAIVIGASNYGVDTLAPFNGYLICGKQDGLYRVRPDGSVNTLWDASNMTDSQNCKYMIAWRNNLVFSAVGSGLYLISPGDTIHDISPKYWGDYDWGDVCGLAAMPDALLALFDDGTTKRMAMGWLETVGEQTGMRWIELRRLTNAVNSCFWDSDYAYYSDGATTSRMPLPMYPEAAPTITATESANIIFSEFNAGYHGRDKVWHTLRYKVTCDANSPIAFKLSEEGGAYTTLATAVATGEAEVDFTAENGTYCQLKIEFSVTDAGAEPPVVEWVELDGYVLALTNDVFEFEVLAIDDGDTKGYEVAEFMFNAAKDTLPPTLTDILGNTYTILIENGYPLESIVNDERLAQPQTVVVVRARAL